MPSVMIMSTDEELIAAVGAQVAAEGWSYRVEADAPAVVTALRDHSIDALVLDFPGAGQDGASELLRSVQAAHLTTTILVLYDADEAEDIAALMPFGLASYYPKTLLPRFREILRHSLSAEEHRKREIAARVLFEEAPVAMLLVDEARGVVLDANPAAARLFGAAGRALAGVDLGSVIGQVSGGAGSDGGDGDDVVDARRVDGAAFRFGHRSSRIEVGGRRLLLLIGRDVTRTEAAQQRYDHLFHETTEAIVIEDPDTREIVDCNEAFAALSNAARVDVIGLTLDDVLRRDSGEETRTSRRITDYDAQLLTRDGRNLSVAVRSSVIRAAGREVRISYVRDMTEQRLSELRYKQIFLQSGDAILVLHRNTRLVLDANPAFERLVGRRLSRIRDQAVDQFLDPPFDVPADEGSRTLRTEDGGAVPVSMQSSMIDASGTVLLTLRDLRPQLFAAEMERSLVQTQRMEALGLMASGIAHDFNNTLMAALPWADLIRRKYRGEETIEKATDHIRRAVYRGSEVTRQLLDFAQPKRSERKMVQLRELLPNQLKMIRPAMPPDIAVRLDLREPDASVYADPAQLSQILLNLCLNARDAMASGGALTIVVRSAGEDDPVAPDEAPSFAIVEVVDTGTGIDRASIDRIFDPFYTTKNTAKGSGLGLSVVQRIIEQHDGRIRVASEPGHGTTFTLALPRFAGIHEVANGGDVSTRSLSGLIVMLIDDEESIVEGVGAVLTIRGIDVLTFREGLPALESLERERLPDAVIMDYGLPDIQGDELHRRIRRMTARLPIVVASGYGDNARIDGLLADPMTRFIQKPYDVDSLVELLASVFPPAR